MISLFLSESEVPNLERVQWEEGTSLVLQSSSTEAASTQSSMSPLHHASLSPVSAIYSFIFELKSIVCTIVGWKTVFFAFFELYRFIEHCWLDLARSLHVVLQQSEFSYFFCHTHHFYSYIYVRYNHVPHKYKILINYWLIFEYKMILSLNMINYLQYSFASTSSSTSPFSMSDSYCMRKGHAKPWHPWVSSLSRLKVLLKEDELECLA